MTAQRIIIIDDEERIRQLLLDFLEDYEEFAATACDSAEAALEELSRGPAALCIVDMRLPGMDGQAFILAAHARGLCSRFLLHTGSMDFTVTDALRTIGMTDADLFLKPADTSQMVERMHLLLALPGEA